MECKNKQLFEEIEQHLLNDKNPSMHIKKLLKDGYLNIYPFSMIGDLKDVLQNPKYHPEGNTFIHVMMVIDKGVEFKEFSGNKRAYMWALLLHDIGKTSTTKLRNGRWTSYNHDVVGSDMSKEFLQYFNESKEFVQRVSLLVRFHMNPLFVTKNMPYSDIEGILKENLVDEIALISLSDRLGRKGIDNEKIIEIENSIAKFVNIVNSYR